ncbi:unnamed protein product [Diplocarpon coronariae]|nr:hypothetical protein JHW43_004771 [Diplocarpon mali]
MNYDTVDPAGRPLTLRLRRFEWDTAKVSTTRPRATNSAAAPVYCRAVDSPRPRPGYHNVRDFGLPPDDSHAVACEGRSLENPNPNRVPVVRPQELYRIRRPPPQGLICAPGTTAQVYISSEPGEPGI